MSDNRPTKPRYAKMKSDSKRARMGGRGQEKTVESTSITPARKRRANVVNTRARAPRAVMNVVSSDKKDSMDSDRDDLMRSPLGRRRDVNAEESDRDCEESKTQGSFVTASLPSVKCCKSGPSARWGHTLTMVSDTEAVLIGGQGDKQHICRDSAWRLDLVRGEWRVADIVAEGTGTKPEHRMGHTAVHDPLLRCVYLFGGSKNQKWFNDVHILDLDEWKWQVVQANGKAPTLAYHSANLYRHELWIFGGVFPQPMSQPDGCSNDVHVFSPIERGWYSPTVSGQKPVPKSGHSATLLSDQLVVFGGWDAPVSYNDLEILDLVTLEWSKPKISGRPPCARSWHASTTLSGDRLLIHGGYNGCEALEDSLIFNLESLTWTKVQFDNLILPRTGHSSICLPYKHENKDSDEVLIFGGGDNEGSYFLDLIEVMVPFEDASTIDVAS